MAEAYETSLTGEEQSRAIRAVSEFVASELPILMLYYEADHMGVRKGVRALDDVQGGGGAGSGYGLYTRNAHRWNLER